MRDKTLRRCTNFFIALLMCLVFASCRQKEEPSLRREEVAQEKPELRAAYEAVLPQTNLPEGWKLAGKVNLYPGKKLYDSIDGAADRFFQYDFREQYVVMYSLSNPDQKIQVEVYDVGTPDDAFGIFSCHDNIMSQHTKIGLTAVISPINLDFCQGRYFLRLQAFGFGDGEAEKPLRSLAETIAANIKPTSELPQLVRRLPSGYVEGTVLCFHTYPTLTERRYIAEENVLNLAKDTNAVLAAYTAEEKKDGEITLKLEKDVMYLIEYPDKAQAQAARTAYIMHLQKVVNDSRAEGTPPAEMLQLIGLPQEPMEIYQLYKGEGEQRRLISTMRVFRNYIFGVWDVTTEARTKILVNGLSANLK
ncbi:MAG: hypothetical protein Q8Q12_20855 [bacterium]|nr:hypothetical protein [bacterium]